jgi:O-antigen ligase
MDLVVNREGFAASPIAGRFWLAGILICITAGCAAALTTWQVAFAPLAMGIVLTCLFKPDWGLYFLIASLFFPLTIVHEPRFYPADIILFLVVIGFWLQRAREGKSGLTHTPLDWPIAVWLGIMALSLVNAYDVVKGGINWLRHVQLLLLLYTTAIIGIPGRSNRIIGLLIILAALFAISNGISFLISGGTERVFGLARIPLSGTLQMCAIYLTARVCFAKNTTNMASCLLLLGLILFGQIANQSRGAIGFTAVGMCISLVLAYWWAGRNNQSIPRRRAALLFFGGFALTVLLVLALLPVLTTVISRFRGVGNAAFTLESRYFLWSTAWRMFLDHPILGIGLGQVQVWHHMFPELRLYPMAVFTFGLGTHNTFLTYLAETGTVGILALAWFMSRVVRAGMRTLRNLLPDAQTGHVIGLWAMVFTIVVRSLVEGDAFYAIAGMTTTLLIGLCLRTIPTEQTYKLPGDAE